MFNLNNSKFLLILLLIMTTVMFFAGCSGANSSDEPEDQAISIEYDENQMQSEQSQLNGQDTENDSISVEEESTDIPSNEQEAKPEHKPEAPSEGSTSTEEQNTAIDAEKALYCTLSITCHTIFDNLDKFDEAKLEILPEDGVIYPSTKVEFIEGETAFDVLLSETKSNKIHMEYTANPLLKSNYVEGIHNLYEFDCGELSGWTYKVNGKAMSFGSSSYTLSDGDVIEWVYTCDQGRDVGAGDW